MTSTALASSKDLAPVIGRVRGRTNHTADLESMVAELLAGTGSDQVFGTQVPANDFLVHWDQTMAKAANRGRLLIAEDLFDIVERKEASISDSYFLNHKATDPETPPYEAVTAIRLMGMLAEEDLIPRAPVIHTLTELLFHDDTQRRYYAVKALWQARAHGALPALTRLAGRESSEEVMSVLRRAIEVLKQRRDDLSRD